MRVSTGRSARCPASKCGPSTTMPQRAARSSSPRHRAVGRGEARPPDARRREPRRPAPAGGDELVAARGDVVERRPPGVRIERPHEPGVADDLGQGRPVAADAPACRAPSPRARARRSPRTPTGTRAPRRRRSGRRGRRRTPARAGRPGPPRPSRVDRRHDVVLGEAAAAEQDERQVGVVPRPGQQVEQEAVVLVRMGDRRVDDVAPAADAVALRGARRRRSRSVGTSTPWGTTTTRSGSRPKASITVPRTYSLGTATTSARRTERGIARRR